MTPALLLSAALRLASARRLLPLALVAWPLVVVVLLHSCAPRDDAHGRPEVLN